MVCSVLSIDTHIINNTIKPTAGYVCMYVQSYRWRECIGGGNVQVEGMYRWSECIGGANVQMERMYIWRESINGGDGMHSRWSFRPLVLFILLHEMTFSILQTEYLQKRISDIIIILNLTYLCQVQLRRDCHFELVGRVL